MTAALAFSLTATSTRNPTQKYPDSCSRLSVRNKCSHFKLLNLGLFCFATVDIIIIKVKPDYFRLQRECDKETKAVVWEWKGRGIRQYLEKKKIKEKIKFKVDRNSLSRKFELSSLSYWYPINSRNQHCVCYFGALAITAPIFRVRFLVPILFNVVS